MSKKNTLKAVKTAKEALELTEQQLKDKAAELIKKREEECAIKVNECLKAFNCTITPSIQIHLNGQLVTSVIKALP